MPTYNVSFNRSRAVHHRHGPVFVVVVVFVFISKLITKLKCFAARNLPMSSTTLLGGVPCNTYADSTIMAYSRGFLRPLPSSKLSSEEQRKAGAV